MTLATTKAAWIVQGEEELGPQRRCTNCGDWYPLAGEFWVVRKGWHERRLGTKSLRHKPDMRIVATYLQPCRGCRMATGRRTR